MSIEVLRRLAAGSDDYPSLLADRWGEAHPESVRRYRTAEQSKRKLTTQQRRTRRRQRSGAATG